MIKRCSGLASNYHATMAQTLPMEPIRPIPWTEQRVSTLSLCDRFTFLRQGLLLALCYRSCHSLICPLQQSTHFQKFSFLYSITSHYFPSLPPPSSSCPITSYSFYLRHMAQCLDPHFCSLPQSSLSPTLCFTLRHPPDSMRPDHFGICTTNTVYIHQISTMTRQF